MSLCEFLQEVEGFSGIVRSLIFVRIWLPGNIFYYGSERDWQRVT